MGLRAELPSEGDNTDSVVDMYAWQIPLSTPHPQTLCSWTQMESIPQWTETENNHEHQKYRRAGTSTQCPLYKASSHIVP